VRFLSLLFLILFSVSRALALEIPKLNRADLGSATDILGSIPALGF